MLSLCETIFASLRGGQKWRLPRKRLECNQPTRYKQERENENRNLSVSSSAVATYGTVNFKRLHSLKKNSKEILCLQSFHPLLKLLTLRISMQMIFFPSEEHRFSRSLMQDGKCCLICLNTTWRDPDSPSLALKRMRCFVFRGSGALLTSGRSANAPSRGSNIWQGLSSHLEVSPPRVSSCIPGVFTRPRFQCRWCFPLTIDRTPLCVLGDGGHEGS